MRYRRGHHEAVGRMARRTRLHPCRELRCGTQTLRFLVVAARAHTDR